MAVSTPTVIAVEILVLIVCSHISAVRYRMYFTLLTRHQCMLACALLQTADVNTEAQGRHPIMRLHPRKTTVVHQSLITTLFYCCFYHYDEPTNNFCSPHYLIEKFKVSLIQLTNSRVSSEAMNNSDSGAIWENS